MNTHHHRIGDDIITDTGTLAGAYVTGANPSPLT
jgi:hypothetical protein